jgi:hypothetical protein
MHTDLNYLVGTFSFSEHFMLDFIPLTLSKIASINLSQFSMAVSFDDNVCLIFMW